MTVRVLAFVAAIGVLGGNSFAEDKKDAPPDEKAIFEAMVKAAAPGEGHKKLKPLEGDWDVTVKMWMDPSKPASESKASTATRWILGGRYLEQKVKGEFAGMKFEGLGLIGYDNLQKRYHSTWFDNFGTGVESAIGKVSDDGKTFTYLGESFDPTTGKKIKGRDVTKIIDDDNYTQTMYKTFEMDGKEQEVKVMEITCKRKRK